MLIDDTPRWDPNYVTPDWAWGSRAIRHLELVVPFGRLLCKRYTGVLVHPNGVLIINNQEIQCDSVEEAKEVGMAMYLLTQEGE